MTPLPLKRKWKLKLSDAVAAAALVLSLYTFVAERLDRIAQDTTNQHRLYYSAYTIGELVTRLRADFCDEPETCAHLRSPIDLSDFTSQLERLQPYLAADQVTFKLKGFMPSDLQPTSHANLEFLIQRALTAQSGYASVTAAFILGEKLERLKLAPVSSTDYEAIRTKIVSGELNELGVCQSSALPAFSDQQTVQNGVKTLENCLLDSLVEVGPKRPFEDFLTHFFY